MDAGDEQTPYLQGAVVAIEASTGDVLAWVGGRDFRHSHFDRVKQARRQAGSAFKPFVYAAALQSGRALNQTLVDEPLRISIDNRRAWEPKNFDGTFDGRVTHARRAGALEERAHRPPRPGGRDPAGAEAGRGGGPRAARSPTSRRWRWARSR